LTDTAITKPLKRPAQAFPLVRHLSWRLSLLLARTQVTPNQLTAASLVAGLACAWYVMQGSYEFGIAAGALLVLCYVFDNSDGEIARIKNLHSNFGMHFDTFADWLVHGFFFAALGIGVSLRTGQDMWLWMGWSAAAGATANYFLGVYLDSRNKGPNARIGDPETPDLPTWKEKALFAFRELSRADFCFIVLALALVDGLWVLLPTGAIGAQIYWVTAFMARARHFHV
jgi:phosphatidylglycerophosphate synthase